MNIRIQMYLRNHDLITKQKFLHCRLQCSINLISLNAIRAAQLNIDHEHFVMVSIFAWGKFLLYSIFLGEKEWWLCIFYHFYVVVEVRSDHFEHRKHNLITIKSPIIVSTFTTNITNYEKLFKKWRMVFYRCYCWP